MQAKPKKPKRPVPEPKVKVKTRKEQQASAHDWDNEEYERTCEFCNEVFVTTRRYNEKLNRFEYSCTDCRDETPCCPNCASLCAKCGSRLCPNCIEETKDVEFPCITHRHCTDCKVRYKGYCSVPPNPDHDGMVPRHNELVWRSKRDREEFREWRRTEYRWSYFG